MRFTKIPENTFKELQLNAGILVDTFTPNTGVIGDILGATTGGVQFKDTLEFEDYGSDVDNAPKNTKELKKLVSHEVTLSGTYVTVNADNIKSLLGAAEVTGDDLKKFVPRNDLKLEDFKDIWWIGDYSDNNDDENGGFIAIHIINALSTDGFQLTSGDRTKGNFPFTYTGHYSAANQAQVPYEVYMKTTA